MNLHRRPLLLMGAFGFASGLPFPLSAFTLRQWLTEGHVSLAAIGLTANIGLPYALKFLWAPLLDQVRPPLGLAWFGLRRGWLLLIQPLLAFACALLALGNPARPAQIAAAAVLVAFLSASQDIGIDAWRIETFPYRLQGAAMAAYVWGYRVALLAAGAGAIWLSSKIGWHGALLAVAGVVGLGTVVTLLADEPAPRLRVAVHGLAARLRAAVVEPFAEFLQRPGAGWVLAFVMLFKLGEALAGTMAVPFYRAMGFDRVQVALATGPQALAASLAAAALGGWLVVRIGSGRALVITGFVQMASQGLYFALAASGGDPRVLVAKVLLENVAEGMADAAFIAYLSGLCSSAFTATQYALLSSLAAVGLRTVGGLSGFLAQALGWERFYGLTIFAALPAMLIMLRLLRRAPALP